MADTMRPMSVLPSIKCSSCGEEIEMSQLADHVCKPGAPKEETKAAPAPSRPPMQRSATYDNSLPAPLKTRGPPPRIDSAAANKPFLSPDSLTPASAGSNRSLSPRSPRSDRISPHKTLHRSKTAPMGLPTPEFFSSNLDCAFPPFPGPKQTATNNNTNFGSRQRQDSGKQDFKMAPLSPRINLGQSVLQRMNTIAPGPFDARRGEAAQRQNSSSSVEDMKHKRTATMASSGSESSIGKAKRPSTTDSEHSRAESNSSAANKTSPAPPVPGAKVAPPRPPRPEAMDDILEGFKELGYTSLKSPPAPTPLSQESKAKTFPLRKQSNDGPAVQQLRRPSEPVIPEIARTTPPPPPPPPQLEKTPARRPSDTAQSINGATPGRRRDMAARQPSNDRPVPKLGLLPGMPNPYTQDLPSSSPFHTPTDSTSSAVSMSGSEGRSFSSMSSAPSSRRPSYSSPRDDSAQDNELSLAVPALSGKEKEIIPVSQPTLQPLPYSPSAEMTNARRSPPTINRPRAPEPLMAPPPRIAPVAEGPESPMDPAIQRGLFSQRRPSNTQVPNPSFTVSTSAPASKPTPNTLTPSPPSARNPKTTSKGNCRGCSQPIVGKSIKAADGRLTGRYHRECFVCHTCRSPFTTSTFYVHDNHPYCDRHYHVLNNSLCRSCDRGIEGQYVEAADVKGPNEQASRKYHARCFTCQDCGTILDRDWFEVQGRRYCERHAMSRVNGPGLSAGPYGGLGKGGRFLERRTTRLMMM